MGSLEQEEFRAENPYERFDGVRESGRESGLAGLNDDSDAEAFGELRENQIGGGNRQQGNDEVVVPMHGAEKEIDFSKVDEKAHP
jgi:hypothetical protein